MPRFSANITFLFRELPITQRFAAARAAGFRAVEILSPEDATVSDLADAAERSAMTVALCNAPMGDFIQGGAGLSAIPGRQQAFREAIHRAAEMASALHCSRVHLGPARLPEGMSWEDCYPIYLENVVFAARRLADAGITATIEPLNTVDFPDIFLSRLDQALRVIEAAAQATLMLQFDVYHMSCMEPDYLSALRTHIGRIAHIQIADSPGRGEPGSGNLDFAGLFGWLDQSAYAGWVGAEYQPSGTTAGSLRWFDAFRESPV